MLDGRLLPSPSLHQLEDLSAEIREARVYSQQITHLLEGPEGAAGFPVGQIGGPIRGALWPPLALSLPGYYLLRSSVPLRCPSETQVEPILVSMPGKPEASVQQPRAQALLAPPIRLSCFRSRETAKPGKPGTPLQTPEGRGIADKSPAIWPGNAKMSCIISKTGQQGRYPLRRPCCSCSGCGRGSGRWRSCHGSCRGLLPLLRTLFCPGPALVSTRPKRIHVEVAPLVLQEKHGRA